MKRGILQGLVETSILESSFDDPIFVIAQWAGKKKKAKMFFSYYHPLLPDFPYQLNSPLAKIS